MSSTAHRTEQAPAPAREHGHFVRVHMNISETTGPSETGGQALRTQCKKPAGSGTTDHPKTAARGKLPLRNHCPFQNQGAKRFGRSASGITRPFAHQKKLDRGPLTTPKQPLALPLALPTPAANGSPSEIAVRSETGGQAPRVQCACAYVIALFLPHFYPIFTPLLPHEG